MPSCAQTWVTELFYELAEKALALERSGKTLLRLNVGDTGLPAPEVAVRAAQACLEKRKFGYGPAAGMIELRERIAKREQCAPENVVIGPGSKSLLFGLLSVLKKTRPKMALPAPYWPAYPLIANHLGLRLDIVQSNPEDGWAISSGISSEPDVMLLCNPLNPTSTVYPDSLVRSILESSSDHGGTVILDEAYRGLSFQTIPRYDGIRLRSFSKEFNMEGWRLGYAVVPKEIVQKLERFNQMSFSCVPEFVQAAGLACLQDEENLLKKNREIWQARANSSCSALSKAGFKFSKPQSGLYVFATHPGITDSEAFSLAALEKGIAVAPGTNFGQPNYFRICLNQEPATLRNAIAALSSCIA